MASHQEIELKLRTDPDKIAKIRRSPLVARARTGCSRQSLHSIYFDTSDQQLRDCNISLRTRTDGHVIVQTVKMLNGRSDSVIRAGNGRRSFPTRSPTRRLVIDPALPEDFRKLTSADLQPVFDVEVKRETRRLTSDGAQIDVSLDNGAVIAGEEREPVHEIELELVAGESDGAVRGGAAHQRSWSTDACMREPRPTWAMRSTTPTAGIGRGQPSSASRRT